jgi:hypothetical protein
MTMTLGERVALELDDVRFTAANEKALQQAIGERLEAAFPGDFVAEFVLGPRERPDFFAPKYGIVLEVKFGRKAGSATDVFSQLRRYAEHPNVRFIVLATPSRRVASAIPEELGGVPITRVVLMTGL